MQKAIGNSGDGIGRHPTSTNRRIEIDRREHVAGAENMSETNGLGCANLPHGQRELGHSQSVLDMLLGID
jgi:hypothetical protein